MARATQKPAGFRWRLWLWLLALGVVGVSTAMAALKVRQFVAIDWVEEASVSRVWPDRLAVRIQERKPVAFVLLHANVLLIDAHGVLLNPPAQAQFTFPVLAGIREEQTPEQRLDCVRAFLQVEQELGYLTRDV